MPPPTPRDFTLASGRARLAGVEAGSEDSGGPPAVFLHAGVADRRMWQDQIAAFAPGRRVVAYDRRGFGETRGQPETFSHLDDLLAVLDQLGIASAVLVGCSQGGRIAIDFALTHPDRVAGLFLAAPAVTGAPSPPAFPPAVEALLRCWRRPRRTRTSTVSTCSRRGCGSTARTARKAASAAPCAISSWP
jgi:pimeloyl-ACP methyl ester carboxylesterase